MVDFVIQASTPERFREEILAHLRFLEKGARSHASVRNQSARVKVTWLIRSEVLLEAISFISKVQIQPERTSP